MKIYTKKGDTGTTQLIGGSRVYKNVDRIEAYGTVDELISHIGSLTVLIDNAERISFLRNIQDRLFTLGSALACEPEHQSIVLPDIQPTDVEVLEHAIDAMNEMLPTLKNFVLPGGSLAAANAHIARCVCRRAERCVVGLQVAESLQNLPPLDPLIIVYLNRLSDYLFVLSRKLLLEANQEEILWQPRKK